MDDRHIDPDWRGWCRTVVEQIRFKPDRWAVRQELAAHMEDRRAALERLGYDRGLATERTLQAMGDPEAVGKALDQAHKPALGWLWEASRGAVLLMVVLLLGNIAFSGYSWPSLRDWALFASQEESAYWDADARDLPCPAPFEAGAYTITVERTEYVAAEDGWGYLHLDLTCSTDQFWLEGPDLWGTLEAEDSNGAWLRVYGSKDNGSHGLYRQWIQVEGILNSPEWIEIRHSIGGWSFRIQLPGGGEET